MRFLIVEDDMISAALLKSILSPFGECSVAETGTAAVKAVESSLNNREPYTLICLDIMLPGIDGQAVLRRIRGMEQERNILGLDGAKTIMITALGDNRNIMEAFRSQCDGYVVKPIRKEKVLEQLHLMGIKTVKGK
jgi:two-component system chemotaxis response regulator CheY